MGLPPADGRAYWLCPTCYGVLMAQHPNSLHAQAWRTQMARHRQREQLVAAITFLDDVDAVRHTGDSDALARLIDRLAARWKLTRDVRAAMRQRRRVEGETSEQTKRRALAAGILLTAESERVPQKIRFGDGSTLRDGDGQTTLVEPRALALPLYDWWFAKDAVRRAGAELVADAPEVNPDAHEPLDFETAGAAESLAALCQEETATDLAEILDRDAERLLSLFSPEQRRIIRKAASDGLSLVDAARALQMRSGTAKKHIARIQRKARLFLKDRRKRT
jgi:DNA-binding CsgD family transcriptional regulator